jgi:hypothetical protein
MEGYIKHILHGWMGAYTCMHMCICMDGLWNWPSKRKRCQCVSGPSSELSDLSLAWPGDGTESLEEVVMGKEFDDRAFEMTAECNGYLGQLPTLSGLQVADPGMADG